MEKLDGRSRTGANAERPAVLRPWTYQHSQADRKHRQDCANACGCPAKGRALVAGSSLEANEKFFASEKHMHLFWVKTQSTKTPTPSLTLKYLK